MTEKIGVIGTPGKWSTEALADAFEARTGCALQYALGWLRQEEIQYMACPPEIARDFAKPLQEQALRAHLIGRAALMLLLQPNQTTALALTLPVQHAPLSFQHSRMLRTGIQAGNLKLNLNLRAEALTAGTQIQALSLQA